MLRKTIFTFLLSLIAVLSIAQPIIEVTQFSDREGLDRNKVTGIMKDKRGFVWISSWGGLYRYDGYRFNSYRIRPGDGNEMENTRMDAIKEDVKGNLWCRSFDRICYFDANTEKFLDVMKPVEQMQQKPCNVNKYFVLENGFVWIVMDNHDCFRINQKCLTDIKKYNFDNNDVQKVYDGIHGDSWVLTKKDTYRVNKRVTKCEHVDFFSRFGQSSIYLGSKNGELKMIDAKGRVRQNILKEGKIKIDAFFSDEKTWMVVCTDHGLYSITGETAVRISAQTDVEQVYRSQSGDYWVNDKDAFVYRISSDGKSERLSSPFTTQDKKNHSKAMYETDGVMVIMKGGHLMNYDTQKHALMPFYLSDGTIFSSSVGRDFVDEDGLLWAGVDNNVFERVRIYRKHYRQTDIGEHILAQFRDSRGLIWQSLDNSLVMVKDARGDVKGYLHPQGNIADGKAKFARVYSFAEDRNGNLYLGSRGNGLFLLKRNGNRFSVTNFSTSNKHANALNDSNVYSLCIDDKERLWVGTYKGGLNLMVRRNDGTVIFRNKMNGLHNFPPCDRTHSIRSIVEVANGVMMIGTSNGIYTFDTRFAKPEDIHFYHSGRVPNDAGSLSSNEVLTVFRIPNHGVFITTSYAGLCILESKNLLTDNLRFRTWSTMQDAPSDEPRCVFVDQKNRLRVVFKNVISHLTLADLSSVDFTFGRDNDEGCYTDALPIPLQDGMELIGSEDGSFLFNPQTVKRNTSKSTIQITDVRVLDRSIPYSLNSDTVTLKSNQRDFVLEFAALELGGSDNVEYAYMLEGRDQTWIRNGRNRTLHFFNLSAGTYTLLIKSTNNDRVWTDNVKRITIIVEPTFWETGWAIALYVIFAFLIVAVAVGIIFYIYRLRMNITFEKRMVDMKLKYFTDISHDLRTPLTLIDGPVTELLEEESLSDKAHSYLSVVHRNAQRMLTLINQILDFRKIQNEKMKLLVEKIDAVSELRSVMSNFDYISQENDIDFKLMTDDDKPVYVWADRDKMDKIFFNLLSNAFKYTKKGNRIWIEVKSDKNNVSLSVCDTGIGMPMNMTERLFERFETILTDNYNLSSSGIGLSLVKELVDMHHARLEVDSKEGQGSRFTVVFRHGGEHFMQDEKTEFLTEDSSVVEMTDGIPSDGQEGVEKMSILIVEDNFEMQGFLRDILKRNFNVLTAMNGKEGLTSAHEAMPDLIISDICMPVMDGWLMVKILRDDVTTSHIPVVLLTAKSSIDDRIEGAKLGVEDYIVKPFNPTYLKTRVNTILQKQRERQEEYSKSFFDSRSSHLLNLPEDNSGVQLRIGRNDAEMMEKLKTFMENNLMKDIVISDLVDCVGLSRTVFYKKVKTLTGLSPIDFSRKYRVERAAQMMREDGLSVSEACYNTGFSDPKYFSRVFKKFFHVAPNDYRKGRQ